MKNIEELKKITRTAFFREMLEKTKTSALIWKEISPSHYVADYEPYQFYISQPFPGTYILDIVKEEKLYKSYNSNFDSILLSLFNEVDYFIIQQKLEKHREISNVVSAAVPITTTEIQLFDESSWQGIVPEPYSSYLMAGKERWEKFLKYNPPVVDLIKIYFPNWNGLRMNSYNYFNDSSSSTIASCGIVDYIDIQTNSPSVQFNALSFNLNINGYYQEIFNTSDWVNVVTHEMGHALGIGIFWNAYFVSQGSVPPSNNFLSSAYFYTQQSYNELTGLSRDRIPLESTGGSGTNSAHWENNYKNSSAPGSGSVDYYGLDNEIMIGYYSAGMDLVISKQSIKHLVDLGYLEKNPGTSEGNPTLAIGLGLANISGKKLECNIDFSQMNKVGTVVL